MLRQSEGDETRSGPAGDWLRHPVRRRGDSAEWGAAATAPGKDPGKQKRAAPRALEAQDPLYASVQTDRYKTQFEDLDYANNNWWVLEQPPGGTIEF